MLYTSKIIFACFLVHLASFSTNLQLYNYGFTNANLNADIVICIAEKLLKGEALSPAVKALLPRVGLRWFCIRNSISFEPLRMK